MDLQTLKKFSKNTIYFGFIDEVKGFVSMEIDITNYVCNLYYAKNNERYSFPFRYIKKLENNQQKQTIKFILKDTQLKNFTCLSDKDYTSVIELIELIIKNQHSKIKTLFREISSHITLELCNGKMRKFGDLIILLTNNRILFFDSMKSEDLPILVLCIKGLTSSKRGKTDVKVEIKKKSFEISFENEYDRDFWFESLQKACSLNEEQSLKIADKIDSLTVLLYSKFNGTNESHLSLLKRLWDGTIKKIVKEDISNVSEYWKKLGFLSANIEINAKEKGFFLAVEGLVFLMDQYPSVFKLIFNNSQTKNFPLCVVCLKFVEWLSDTLGLEKKERGIPLHLPTLCTFPNFTHDVFAFELILGITLQLFDEMWKNEKMNLNEVVEGVIQQVTQFLEKLPRGGIPHIFENMLFVLGEKSISSSMNEYDIEKTLSFANKFMLKNKENSKDSIEEKSISSSINTAFLKEVISSDPSKKINDISIFSQRNWFSKYLDSSEERRDVVTLPIDFNSKASLEQLTEKRFLLKQLNQKHRKLSSNYEVLKSKHLCVACKTKEREIVLLPCSHLSLCSECHTKMATEENCPLCKSKRVGSFKIHKV